MADAARLYLDADVSCAWLRNLALDEFEIASGHGDLRQLHRRDRNLRRCHIRPRELRPAR